MLEPRVESLAPNTSRPADDCPYERPFEDDFDECPAYAARRFVPFDSMHRPLNPIWTCNFLAPKRAVDKAHGYYACCSLGDAAARVAYVERIHKERFDQLTHLQRGTAELVKPYLFQLYAAKSRQLEGVEHAAEAAADLEDLLRRLETEVAGFIDHHAEEFEAMGMPVVACKALMSAAVRDMIDRRHLGNYSFVPSTELVDQFPAELRPLLFPPATQT